MFPKSTRDYSFVHLCFLVIYSCSSTSQGGEIEVDVFEFNDSTLRDNKFEMFQLSTITIAALSSQLDPLQEKAKIFLIRKKVNYYLNIMAFVVCVLQTIDIFIFFKFYLFY